MPVILTIDTATNNASVSLSFEGKVLLERVSGQPMDHAAWIHTAIKELMSVGNLSYGIKNVSAVAVVAGPGSYTGLRVGMATAKGMCYALNIPLISLGTLKIMAHATNVDISSSLLLCPMLDARRMEVFTALYDAALNELMQPCALILEKNSFSDWLAKHTILFFGNGNNKWKEITESERAVFEDIVYQPQHIAGIAYEEFLKKNFSDMAYTEPIYLKEFYSYQNNKR